MRESLPVVFAKLAAHSKTLRSLVEGPAAKYFDPATVVPICEAVVRLLEELRVQLPDLYGDLPQRAAPTPFGTTDFDGRGYVARSPLEGFLRDLEYAFEVRAGSQAALVVPTGLKSRVFISHGPAPEWREVQAFVERDVGLSTLELAQEPNRGRTVLQKLAEESERCSYAVIVMTGDDEVDEGPPRARENVIHEIGYFQGKFGLTRVALLHEEGTNIPSNIHGLVYIPFPRGLVTAALGTLFRELKDAFPS